MKITDTYFSTTGEKSKQFTENCADQGIFYIKNHTGPVIELKIFLEILEINLYFQSYCASPG